jgi:CHAD domain-containing protein
MVDKILKKMVAKHPKKRGSISRMSSLNKPLHELRRQIKRTRAYMEDEDMLIVNAWMEIG